MSNYEICDYHIHKIDLADLSSFITNLEIFASKIEISFTLESGNLQREQPKFPVFWQNFQIPCVFPVFFGPFSLFSLCSGDLVKVSVARGTLNKPCHLMCWFLDGVTVTWGLWCGRPGRSRSERVGGGGESSSPHVIYSHHGGMIKAEDLLMKSTSRGWWVGERPGGGGYSVWKRVPTAVQPLMSCGCRELRWLQKGGLSSYNILPEGSCHILNC